MEVDNDQASILVACSSFPRKDDAEESRKAERDFEVIDPRERDAKVKVSRQYLSVTFINLIFVTWDFTGSTEFTFNKGFALYVNLDQVLTEVY